MMRNSNIYRSVIIPILVVIAAVIAMSVVVGVIASAIPEEVPLREKYAGTYRVSQLLDGDNNDSRVKDLKGTEIVIPEEGYGSVTEGAAFTINALDELREAALSRPPSFANPDRYNNGYKINITTDKKLTMDSDWSDKMRVIVSVAPHDTHFIVKGFFDETDQLCITYVAYLTRRTSTEFGKGYDWVEEWVYTFDKDNPLVCVKTS